jgi:hypothetical protein
MIQDPFGVLVEDVSDRLEYEAINESQNRETHYMAAKLLRAFNDLFAPTWKDVNDAERMRKDREADRKAGFPWIGDDCG